jgi:hypothetical protein
MMEPNLSAIYVAEAGMHIYWFSGCSTFFFSCLIKTFLRCFFVISLASTFTAMDQPIQQSAGFRPSPRSSPALRPGNPENPEEDVRSQLRIFRPLSSLSALETL